jgi:hypothetical protein
VFLSSMRNWRGWLFTNDTGVANCVSLIMPVLAYLASVDAIQRGFDGCVDSNSELRGDHRQPLPDM